MIVIKHAKVDITKSGKVLCYEHRVLEKRPNKWLETLDFDYLDPESWRKFLYNDFRTKEGYKLPVKTKDGEDVAYEVFIYGVPSELVQRARIIHGNVAGGMLHLFPGYPGIDDKYRDAKGKIKPLNFAKHGMLIPRRRG